MSDHHPINHNTKRTAEQNAQARLVLIQLLWLFMALIIAALVWLANKQKQLSVQVDERLKITETFSGRMNDMDDRIFAMATIDKEPKDDTSAQSHWQLTAIQLAAADRLYQDGDYKAAIDILYAIDWQLGNDALNLSAPIKSALKSTIKQDITTMNTLRNQTDPWQADMIELRQLQRQHQSLKGEGILQKELLLRDIDLLLTLTLGAAQTHDRQTMLIYLNQIANNYQKLAPFYPMIQDGGSTITEASHKIQKLIDNEPKLPPLTSLALL